MQFDAIANRGIRSDSNQGVGLHVALVANLKAVWTRSDTTLHGVMGVMDLDQYNCGNYNARQAGNGSHFDTGVAGRWSRWTANGCGRSGQQERCENDKSNGSWSTYHDLRSFHGTLFLSSLGSTLLESICSYISFRCSIYWQRLFVGAQRFTGPAVKTP